MSYIFLCCSNVELISIFVAKTAFEHYYNKMMLPVFFRVRTDIADLIELSTGEKVNFLNDLLFFLFSILLLFFFTKRFGPVIYLKNVTQGL